MLGIQLPLGANFFLGLFMNIEDVIKSLNLKFTSGNTVPVERATITKEEWLIIKNTLNIKEISNGHISIS